MDIEQETKKFKIMLWVLLVMLISGWFSVSELKYLIWGKTCDAHIVNHYESRARSRSQTPHVAVVYEYDDGGTKRQDSDQMPLGWEPETASIRVQYIPGSDYASRIEGHTRRGALYVFGACVLVIGYFVGSIIMESREATRPRRATGDYWGNAAKRALARS